MAKAKEKTENTEVALFGSQSGTAVAVTDYDAAAGLGNENVGSEDLAIPRIVIVESNSAAILDGLEGARPGLLQNTITNDFFESLLIVPLYYEIQYTVWKSRDLGGGIQGTFDTLKEASEHMETLQGGEKAHNIAETAKHAILVLDDEGNVLHPAIMHFSGTRLTASKQWNSAIQLNHPQNAPRFAGIWRLFPEKKSNSKGTWFVPGFDFMGLSPKAQYDAAFEMYNNIKGTTQAA